MARQIKIHPSWAERLSPEFSAPYFADLVAFVRQEYTHSICYPPGRQIFNAFDLCPFESVRVVILGQDPYHEPKQAEGLCFSVADGVPFPPSLRNIFQEIHDELGSPILWGSYAQRKGAFIDRSRHLVLEAAHPSPLSAYRGFFGCGHFLRCNEYLTNHNLQPIQW